MRIPAEVRNEVIRLLQQGMSSGEIADIFGLGKMQVADIKAHVTMNDVEETAEKVKKNASRISLTS